VKDDSPIRVLVVDDHAVARRTLRVLLEPEEGVEIVAEAGNGAEALELLERDPGVALVISDLRMPKMDGLEPLRTLEEPPPDTAVVLITAERGAVPKLGEQLAALEGVSEVYSVTGDFDFIAMVRAREHEDLADIVTRRIAQVPGVARTQTHVAFRAYSKHDLESLFAP